MVLAKNTSSAAVARIRAFIFIKKKRLSKIGRKPVLLGSLFL